MGELEDKKIANAAEIAKIEAKLKILRAVLPEDAVVEKTKGPVAADGTLIRAFSNTGIQAQIDKAIATLPPDTHGAVIAYATTESVEVAIVGKKDLGGGQVAWTVVAKKPYDGPLEAEAAVRYTW